MKRIWSRLVWSSKKWASIGQMRKEIGFALAPRARLLDDTSMYFTSQILNMANWEQEAFTILPFAQATTLPNGHGARRSSDCPWMSRQSWIVHISIRSIFVNLAASFLRLRRTLRDSALMSHWKHWERR